MLILTDYGAASFLNMRLKADASRTLYLKLFTNAHTPSRTDVANNYTEAVGGGYAAITLDPANWVVTQDQPSTAIYPLQTFIFTGSLTTNPMIRGYYIVDGDNNLIWAELDPAPYVPATNGDKYYISLQFSLSLGNPA